MFQRALETGIEAEAEAIESVFGMDAASLDESLRQVVVRSNMDREEAVLAINFLLEDMEPYPHAEYTESIKLTSQLSIAPVYFHRGLGVTALLDQNLYLLPFRLGHSSDAPQLQKILIPITAVNAISSVHRIKPGQFNSADPPLDRFCG
ncbi:hypothetical protein IFO70_12100 [Phormidium tenue FACHB-886]|nr:hypothetical protein [Phormidium tenue FACHB-886]